MHRSCCHQFVLSYMALVWLGGIVVGCWARDQQVAGSNPNRSTAECNPGKFLTHVCLCHQAV